MNPDNNSLIRYLDVTPDGYIPLPDDLVNAANRVLGANAQVFISKTSGGKLSRWAAQQRKQKRKMAKASKKRNRK